MSDGPDLETRLPSDVLPASIDPDPSPADGTFGRTLLFFGIAAFFTALAFAVVRGTLMRPPADPTTERIQQLIDEANRLLAQLDEKKSES